MRSWLSVLITDAESKKVFDIPIAPSLYSLSNKMDNSLLAVRDINHKYIVVERRYTPWIAISAAETRKKVYLPARVSPAIATPKALRRSATAARRAASSGQRAAASVPQNSPNASRPNSSKSAPAPNRTPKSRGTVPARHRCSAALPARNSCESAAARPSSGCCAFWQCWWSALCFPSTCCSR